jgi:hypothetical protein
MAKIFILSEAQKSNKIKAINGTDSNRGMTIIIHNDENTPILIKSELGTVIGSKDPKIQRMLVVREKSFEVSPSSDREIAIDALCLEAKKAPPRSSAEANHNVEGLSGDENVMSLVKAVQSLESEISKNILEVDQKTRRFRHSFKKDDKALMQLATVASHSADEEGEAYTSEIYDHIIQMALWQVTDKLDLIEYAKVLRLDLSPDNIKELRSTVEKISTQAQFAQAILNEAELKPTIEPLENELEKLSKMYELLGSKINQLEKVLIFAKGDEEADIQSRIECSKRDLKEVRHSMKVSQYTSENKNTLLNWLCDLPVTGTMGGRTSLLDGISDISILSRSESIQRQDLDQIIKQLAAQERGTNGELPFVKFIDNALPYAKGFMIQKQLEEFKQKLQSL